MVREKAIQDFYPDHQSYCYGCGKLNEQGLQIKSFIHGDEVIAKFTPKSYHIAIPGYVYGGLIASLIDCHSTGAAAAGVYMAENRSLNSEPAIRFVTASLKVDYLRPTPLGEEIEIRARIKEIKGKKVIVESKLSARGVICATGEVVAVQIPEDWDPESK